MIYCLSLQTKQKINIICLKFYLFYFKIFKITLSYNNKKTCHLKNCIILGGAGKGGGQVNGIPVNGVAAGAPGKVLDIPPNKHSPKNWP